jgi:hypothetical protein
MEVGLQSSVNNGVFNLKYTRKRADPEITLPTVGTSTVANTISLLTSAGNYRSSAGTAVADKIGIDSARVTLAGFTASGATGDATWIYFAASSGNPDPHIFINAEL